MEAFQLIKTARQAIDDGKTSLLKPLRDEVTQAKHEAVRVAKKWIIIIICILALNLILSGATLFLLFKMRSK